MLEQFKEYGFYIALDKISEKRVKQAEYEKEAYKKENELFYEFLKSCNAEKQFKEYLKDIKEEDSLEDSIRSIIQKIK